MINKDRVVPVKATDLISLYGTIIAIGKTIAGDDPSFDVLDALDTEGNFDVSGASGEALASQPVKTVKIDEETDLTLYFVADYAYAGFIGATAVTGDEVGPDSADLYKAGIVGGVVNIARITPAAN